MEVSTMSNIQNDIIKELGVLHPINAEVECQKRVRFLKEYLKNTQAKGFVLGISGGQDSTLAGKLAQLAITQLKSEGYGVKFLAVRLPYGTQQDEKDAQDAINFIHPDETIAFNIISPVNSFVEQYTSAVGKQLPDFHKGNVKARMRMITQYAIGGDFNLLVLGTDHAAEAISGFFTKFGDGGADILPLSGLTKRQGKQLLQYLACPEHLYTKKPTADLLDNTPQQQDETELGTTYDEIDDYLEGKKVSSAVSEKIETRYRLTRHKRMLPVTPTDTWWN